ncbi:MAG TPA: hypothetical protein VEI02_01430, partial [Planctomycetota bacterium]|nr:hypothetical protein [Planctomycetota bacterium]
VAAPPAKAAVAAPVRAPAAPPRPQVGEHRLEDAGSQRRVRQTSSDERMIVSSTRGRGLPTAAVWIGAALLGGLGAAVAVLLLK